MTSQHFEFQYPRILSIAGSDSGGGAGIQADLKTFSALGCYGMTAITALTAQNTLGVSAIHTIPVAIIRAQIDAVVEDIGLQAVKIGMLHSPEIVQTVAQSIERHKLANVVLDPVMVATSGAVLIDSPAITALVYELFSRSIVVTPNLDEASLLVESTVDSEPAMEAAAKVLLGMGAKAVLLKGGHLMGDVVSDLLVTQDGLVHWMRASRILTANTHGTGCTLSSAIAAHLALGAHLVEAVEAARTYVRAALDAGAKVQTGKGSGPLNHGYAPHTMRVLPLR